ncbi:MAG: isocitrate lyase/PEP mutase family protein [Acidimicrobiia bacterium]
MATQREKAEHFLRLHRGATPLVMPNPWDIGTTKLLGALGFAALATTSAGFAATKGRLDYSVVIDEVVDHAGEIVGATELPVNADFENAFADEPEAVAANVTRAAATGLAGLSVEDFTGRADGTIYDRALARDRIAAAADALHRDDAHLVLTARAENYLHGRRDLADTITRLQAYQEAGADVLYAPGVTDPGELRSLVAAVDRPVNVLALPGAPSVAELGVLGVSRVSVGSGFSLVALGAVVEAARELLDEGTYGFWSVAGAGAGVVRAAFTPPPER